MLTRTNITDLSNHPAKPGGIVLSQTGRKAKIKLLFTAIFFLTSLITSAQTYEVKYHSAGPDSLPKDEQLFPTSFNSQIEAGVYLAQLPATLRNKGYIAASVDSVRFDSLFAVVTIYLGEQYRWTRIHTRPEDEQLLQAVRWPASFSRPVQFEDLQAWQMKILDYLEEHGHPFGRVYLDSVGIHGNEISALLRIETGPIYTIDSIRVFGDARIKNDFLQRYLGIPNGSLYNKKKLQAVSARLAEISYVQEERPSDLTMLGTGSVLNLYLKNRKTSQINALIGFLPNSDQLQGGKKFLLTVDANLMLRNALGSGETIGFVWQQLQQQSPRLNLIYDQPYIFRSPVGLNFTLDMYKRDSTFLNINMNLGATYRFEESKSATLFIQRRSSIVNGVNTNAVLASRKLPREADVSSVNLGVGYNFNNTDYRFNPGKGRDITISASAGTKRIRKNNSIVDLIDPNDPSFKFESLYDTVKLKAYQFRVTLNGAQFIPLGGQSTLKLGLNAGIYQSANYFRNELFQIGGFRLMRGFDEESQFVSQYGIGTVEYRLRTGLNSYFFGFVDGGWGKHLLEADQHHQYLGAGLGLSLESKAGIINMAVALGKRDDTEFNLRQPKVHIGFASYF